MQVFSPFPLSAISLFDVVIIVAKMHWYGTSGMLRLLARLLFVHAGPKKSIWIPYGCNRMKQNDMYSYSAEQLLNICRVLLKCTNFSGRTVTELTSSNDRSYVGDDCSFLASWALKRRLASTNVNDKLIQLQLLEQVQPTAHSTLPYANQPV